MDHEREAAAPAEPVRVEHAGLEARGDDHVQQVVVGQPTQGARGGGQHHRLEDRGRDGEVEGLGGGVQHHVDVEGGQLGQPIIGDRGGHHGLARAGCRPRRPRARRGSPTMTWASSRARRANELLRRCPGAFTWDRTGPGQLAHRPHSDVRGQAEHRVGVHPLEDVQAEQRVGELEVLRVLLQDPDGAGVVHAAEHHDAGVGEVAGHRVLHVPDRPLLQHVAQGVAVGDRDHPGGPLDPVDGFEVPVVQAGDAGLADAGHGDHVSLVGPLADQLLGRGHVTVGADPAQVELLLQEGDVLVVVPVGAGEADVDDDGGLVGGHCCSRWGGGVQARVGGGLRSSPRSRTPGGRP